MKNYVGRKIKGFRFEDGTDGVAWTEDKASYINKVGLIIKHAPECVVAEFEDDEIWAYPISLIEPHLIEEDKVHGFCNTPEEKCNLNYCDNYGCQNRKRVNVDETPEIPQLGEGVFMQVSDNGEDWCEAYIIAKLANGRFLATNKLTWEHARPIKQLPKYTHAELVEKLGEDFIYEKI